MNFSNYRFTLDIQKAKTQASIPVHFRDTGNRFYITLTDGGNPYIITDGCRVDIYMRKPNGQPLINSCIIENNSLVRYDFNNNTASVEGIHKCELRLYSSDGRLITTPSFVMVVDQRVFYDDEIGTEEDMQTLLALDVIAKEQERRTAEFERWEAEELRALAEESRAEAESGRITAETERAVAENARAEAEAARALAENERGQELAVLKPYVETHIPDHEARISANEGNITNHTSKLADHDTRLAGIEGYLGGDNFILDDSIAYRKSVPKNACEKAKILKIGGMTYRDEETNTFKHAKVTAVESIGKNLIDVSQAINGNFVDNGDGTYTLTQNGNGNRFSAKVEINIPPNSTIYYSATTIANKLTSDFAWRGIQLQFFNGSSDVGTLLMNRTTTVPKGATHARFYIDPDEAVGAYITVKDIQIEYGSTKTEYKPYVGTLDTFAIPEAVQTSADYGMGIDATYNNHFEFAESGVKYAHKCKEIVFDGTENWSTSATSPTAGANLKRFALVLTDKAVNVTEDKQTPLICNAYTAGTAVQTWQSENVCAIYRGEQFYFCDPNYQTVSTWKAYLAEQYANGTPVKVVYALAEPIVTDVTEYFTHSNLIAVQGGGSIVAVNAEKLAAPFSIKYLVTYPKEAN